MTKGNKQLSARFSLNTAINNCALKLCVTHLKYGYPISKMMPIIFWKIYQA